MRIRMLVIASVMWFACSDPLTTVDDGPDPGFVTVEVASATQNAAAVRLTLFGPVIDSVSAAGLTVFGEHNGTNEYRAIIVGAVTNSRVLRFWAPDRNQISSYQVVLNEAASAGSYAQLDPGAFTVTLSPEGS